ncbi:NUDIX domain-containing protein [Streptomyces bikiniensis]|uniref:NUDIX domain-containing protein n=1 Tax=Streptomyces bikiniensis TaxID=1896 RepID=UPI0009969581|nr:NUDIX hydrolase [Streptomyces bikiniensis]
MSAQTPEPYAPSARSSPSRPSAPLSARPSAPSLTRPSASRPERVLLHRRASSPAVRPDRHDVLIGGAVRTGEEYRAAALRELREEPGGTEAAGLTEAYRVRVDGPHGASFPAVHRWTADPPLRPGPREIARCGFVAPPTVVTGGCAPPVPAGAEAVRRLFPL